MNLGVISHMSSLSILNNRRESSGTKGKFGMESSERTKEWLGECYKRKGPRTAPGKRSMNYKKKRMDSTDRRGQEEEKNMGGGKELSVMETLRMGLEVYDPT